MGAEPDSDPKWGSVTGIWNCTQNLFLERAAKLDRNLGSKVYTDPSRIG